MSHLSLLGQISGELGLDDVSDLTSWESGQISASFWSLLTEEKHISGSNTVKTSWSPFTCMKTQTMLVFEV